MDGPVFDGVIGKTCDLILTGQTEFPFDPSLAEKIRKSGEGDSDPDASSAGTSAVLRLGDYVPMASPGTIRLYWRPLGHLFAGAWADLQVSNRSALPLDDIKTKVCRMVVGKTYFHEQLHFMWDWARNQTAAGQCLPGGHFEKEADREEALATAWSWYCTQVYGKELGLPVEIVETVARYCFDIIGQPGYKDWKDWAHGCFFESGFADYFRLGSMMPEDADPRDHIPEFLGYMAPGAGSAHYEVHDVSAGTRLNWWPGNPSAFPAFVSCEILHSAATYYPKSCCDLRTVPNLQSGTDIANYLTRNPDCADKEDMFICRSGSLNSLNGLEQFEARRWKRVCLRHDGVVRGLIYLATGREPGPWVYSDDPRLQQLLNAWKGHILDLADLLIDGGFDVAIGAVESA